MRSPRSRSGERGSTADLFPPFQLVKQLSLPPHSFARLERHHLGSLRRCGRYGQGRAATYGSLRRSDNKRFFTSSKQVRLPRSFSPFPADPSSSCSNMLVVTLHGQTQPVFVDLREQSQGRWELETPPDEEEEEDDDDEDAPRIIRCVALSLLSMHSG
jgi:hypothetical protein